MTPHEINPFVRMAAYTTQLSGLPIICYDNRIIYVKEGSIKLILNGKTYVLSRGSAAIIKSSTMYYAKMIDNVRIMLITFDYTGKGIAIDESIKPDSPQNFKKEKVIEDIHFDEINELNDFILIDNMEIIEEKLLKIMDEFTTQKIYYRERCSGIIKDIIFYIARHLSVKSEHPQIAAEMIVNYIKDNYASQITHKDISALTNYHENYINTIMKQYTGKTLSQYIINYRILISKNLLLTTKLSAAQIAERTGFNYTSYFTACFKQITGTTPHKFRRINSM